MNRWYIQVQRHLEVLSNIVRSGHIRYGWHITRKQTGLRYHFSYDMWQYTSKASVSGANTSAGYCDLNYYLVKNG